MGQAKQRGTYEQRKAEAMRGEASLWDDVASPVDLETFKYAFEVWIRAGNGSMAVENPGANPCLVDGDTGQAYLLADKPINRAGMAVSSELREAGVRNIPAYTMRLMHIGQLFSEHQGALSDFFKMGDSSEEAEIDSVLIEAMATAEFIVRMPAGEDPGFMGFNIADVAEKANRLAAARNVH